MLHCARHPRGDAAYAGAMRFMRSTWTDSRLDDLNQRVGELSNRVDKIQHTMVHGFIAIMVGMLTGFMGLAGLIVAQL
jgi:hypothetical protein